VHKNFDIQLFMPNKDMKEVQLVPIREETGVNEEHEKEI
jgi:hypothetical protein